MSGHGVGQGIDRRVATGIMIDCFSLRQAGPIQPCGARFGMIEQTVQITCRDLSVGRYGAVRSQAIGRLQPHGRLSQCRALSLAHMNFVTSHRSGATCR